VGRSFAHAHLIRGLKRKIVANRTLDTRSNAMDLSHAMPFCSPHPNGDFGACTEADVVIITAGARQEPRMSRLELTQKNTEMIKSMIASVMEHTPNLILLIVSNPLDILTYMSFKESGLSPSRAFCSEPLFDSARFLHLRSRQCGVAPAQRSLHCGRRTWKW
jgi:L-lactate dehydrogenase